MELYLLEGVSYLSLKENHGLLLNESNFQFKLALYQTHGLNALKPRSKSIRYSESFKRLIVQEHIDEGTSAYSLAVKHNLPGTETIRHWIIKYTNREENNRYSLLPEVYTMKNRKTTLEEKVKIVEDYLENHLTYNQAAEKYQVSYKNVYTWVQKYNKHGLDGLIDSRGSRKPTTIQTNEEKLKAKIAALEARNEYLETENAAIKKLQEVERELMSGRHGTKQNSKRLKSYKKKDSK